MRFFGFSFLVIALVFLPSVSPLLAISPWSQDGETVQEANPAETTGGEQNQNAGGQNSNGTQDEPNKSDSTVEAKSGEQEEQSEGQPDAEEGSEEANDEEEAKAPPLITNDAVTFGLLLIILGFIFYTNNLPSPRIQMFYKLVPMLLLCYFLPSLLTFFRIVDPEESKLYHVASRYLLPASLVLLTLSIDLKEIFRLGPKALVMFLTGTVGVVLGGPIAILIVASFSPELVGGSGFESVWRGFSTVAGSWIGGGANQAAMKEIWFPIDQMTSDEAKSADKMYSVMVAIDVIVAEIWMVFLLLGVGKADTIDRLFKADASSIERLKNKMEAFSLKKAKVASSTDLMVILAVAFGITAAGHWMGDALSLYISENYPFLNKFSLDSSFFWLIVLSTTFGIILSFTPFRNYEGAGASKVGTVFIFILVATIGMKMDIMALKEHPGLFLVGGIWMLFHVVLLVTVGWLIRAPYFFLAVGSKANIGGAASAPVVAAAFHPSLAPVGVLLAVLGYALGTYGAWLCAVFMQYVAPVN